MAQQSSDDRRKAIEQFLKYALETSASQVSDTIIADLNEGWVPEDVRELLQRIGEELTETAEGTFSIIESSEQGHSLNKILNP